MDEGKLVQLETESSEALLRFFKAEDLSPSMIGAAKIAASAFSTCARRRATATAEKALGYQMARDLASDKDRLAEYVAVSMPSAPIVKALPKGK